MGKQKTPSVIRPDQRLPDLLQQPDEFLQLALGEMAHELMMQGDQRLIKGSQGRHALVRERHIDDPAILLAAQPVDERRLLQPVYEAGDARHHGNGAAGDLQNGQGLPLTPQDAQDVVLRGRQAMLPQQPGGAYLKPITGPYDAQKGFLFGRLEGPLLLEFLLQLRGRHGSIRAVHSPGYSLYVIYLL